MAAPVLCLVALFAGCTSDQEGSQTVATEPPAKGSEPIQAAECQDLSTGPHALIEIADFRFDPPCVEMTTSQGFTLRNNGENLHNFSVEGFAGIDVDLEPGQENNTENPGLDADVYTFFCEYHRDRGMEGELRVASG